MTCEGEYQSVRCWEFSELITTPCQSFTKPHLQIGSRPMARRIAACSTAMAATAARARTVCLRARVMPASMLVLWPRRYPEKDAGPASELPAIEGDQPGGNACEEQRRDAPGHLTGIQQHRGR